MEDTILHQKNIINGEFKFKENDPNKSVVSVVIKPNNGVKLWQILQIAAKNGFVLEGIESRSSLIENGELEFLIGFKPSDGVRKETIANAIGNDVAKVSIKGNVDVFAEKGIDWFPRSVYDLDKCRDVVAEVDPELGFQHPGFGDRSYRARRTEIIKHAMEFSAGDPLPHAVYSQAEIDTWTYVFKKVKGYIGKYACKEYIEQFRALEDCGLLREDNIPQIRDVSAYLEKKTGFSLRPVGGLVTPRDFLNSLAFKVFQCTQYIRHPAQPEHSPEPDCIHEMLGHVPMFADPDVAQFSQEIGMASIGASDEDVDKLGTLYWFTIEFGLCKQGNELKAYGAALLSSAGEIEHALSDVPEHLPFVPEETAVQPYQYYTYQPAYYYTGDIAEATQILRSYLSKIKKPVDMRYNSKTNTVEII